MRVKDDSESESEPNVAAAPSDSNPEDAGAAEDVSENDGDSEDEPEQPPPHSLYGLPAPAVAATASSQIERVLGGLGLSSLGTNLQAHELLMEISILAPNSRAALQNFRQKVQQDTEAGVLGEALEPIANFLQRRDPRWCTHNRDIDSLWESFADDLVRLGESKIDREYLVKPSGPLRAALTCLWVYPTFKTSHPKYGHVHDRTNPSLRLQDDKIGANDRVRTQDRIPIRHDFVSDKNGGVPWQSEYPNWSQIHDKCHTFNKELLKHSRVIVFVGKENCTTWKSFLDLDKGDRVQQVQFKFSAGDCDVKLPLHIYGQSTAYYMIRASSSVVKQLVFLAFHSQYMIKTNDYLRGAYNDLVWNAACSFAGLDIVRHDAFVNYTGTNGTMPRGPGPTIDPASVPRKKRTGAKAADATKPMVHCYHVDPDSGKQCGSYYTALPSLRSHFEKKHPESAWDASLPEWKVVDEDASLEEELGDPRIAMSAAMKRARQDRHQVKSKQQYVLACTLCQYTNAMHYSNMKTHLQTKHPNVPYDSALYEKRAKPSD